MVSKALRSELADLRAAAATVTGEADRHDLEATIALMRRTVPDSTDAEPQAIEAARQLPRAWRPQRFHAVQAAAFRSSARYRAIEAGRRSGKSEGRKREIVIAALDPAWPLEDRFLVVGAPTQQQAMRLYWRALLRLIPPRFLLEERKTDSEIELTNGAVIRVIGMDKPQRAEGDPIDGLWLDEFADMRLGRAVLDDHLAPSLDTPDRPEGRVTVYGTPDMRCGAHFVDLCDRWRDRVEGGDASYGYWHWSSQGIVSEAQWQEAREHSDPASFAVEYEARRVSTGNRAYYTFSRERHVARGLRLLPNRPAILCCDWNFDPGTASIVQEQTAEDYRLTPGVVPDGVKAFTAVLREVFIRRSNTPEVMRKVLAVLEAERHVGPVHAYGDPAGGASGSAKVAGSDLDLVRSVLGPRLGERLSMRFERSAPAVIARLNAVNARLLNAAGDVRLLVDAGCREMIRDFEVVRMKEGAAGEIDKSTKGDNAMRTHLCFHGDTLVETPTGPTRMADLPRAGLVRGPFGEFVRFEDAGLTIADAEMIRLEVAGSAPILCTPWHLMCTKEAGWVRADRCAGLTLVSSASLRMSSDSSACRIGAKAATSSAGSGGCIGWSGSTSVGRSRPAERGMSITSTATGRTTTSRTWSCSRSASTCPGMGRAAPLTWSRGAAPSSLSFARRPRSGIAAPMAAAGIRCTPVGSRNAGPIARTARSALASSWPAWRGRASVARRARLLRDGGPASTTRPDTAPGAGLPSRSGATCEPSTVRGRVLRVDAAPSAPAFCLRQREHGCFALLDGWVVSNSDGLGYYVAAQFPMRERGSMSLVDR